MQPIQHLLLQCPESKTLTATPHPIAATEMFLRTFQAIQSSHPITDLDLQWYAVPLTQNPKSALQTCLLIFKHALLADLDIRTKWILETVTIKQALLLAHFKTQWLDAFIQFHFLHNQDHVLHISRFIKSNLDVYCNLLELYDLSDWTWELPMDIPKKWFVAYLHPEPRRVFRSMKWYPKSRVWEAFQHFTSQGKTPLFKE